MNKITTHNFYTSSDISLIGYLCCQGYVVDSMDKSDDGSVKFIIKRDEHLDKIVQLYFSEQALVNPSMYNYHIRKLKTAIYHTGV